MMSGFEVSAAELQATGTFLVHVAKEVRDQVASLRAEVDGLLSGGWSGYAATGFARGWREWEQGANDVLAALSTMADLLGETGRNYTTAEDTNTGDAARIESEL